MHNEKNTSPIGPESPQDDPEHPVMEVRRGRGCLAANTVKLLTECQILQYEVAASSNTAAQG